MKLILVLITLYATEPNWSHVSVLETKAKRSTLDSEAQIPKEPHCPFFSCPLQINRAPKERQPN